MQRLGEGVLAAFGPAVEQLERVDATWARFEALRPMEDR